MSPFTAVAIYGHLIFICVHVLFKHIADYDHACILCKLYMICCELLVKFCTMFVMVGAKTDDELMIICFDS